MLLSRARRSSLHAHGCPATSSPRIFFAPLCLDPAPAAPGAAHAELGSASPRRNPKRNPSWKVCRLPNGAPHSKHAACQLCARTTLSSAFLQTQIHEKTKQTRADGAKLISADPSCSASSPRAIPCLKKEHLNHKLLRTGQALVSPDHYFQVPDRSHRQPAWFWRALSTRSKAGCQVLAPGIHARGWKSQLLPIPVGQPFLQSKQISLTFLQTPTAVPLHGISLNQGKKIHNANEQSGKLAMKTSSKATSLLLACHHLLLSPLLSF